MPKLLVYDVFALAAALGPIYWFPFVPPDILTILKAFLVLLLGATVIGKYGFSVKVPLARAALVLCVAGALSSIYHEDTSFFELLPPLVFLWIGSALARFTTLDQFDHAIERAVIIFSVFPALVLIDAILGGVFMNPFYGYDQPLYLSGFHGGRTGWAFSSNLFLALMFQLTLGKIGAMQKKFYLFLAILCSLNIFIVGARGGVLVAAMNILVYVFLLSRQNLRAGLKVGMSLLLTAIVFVGVFQELLPTSRIYQSLIAENQSTAELTNNRVDGYALAVSEFEKHPLFGVGDVKYGDGENALEIHNLWLRFLAEKGIIYTLPCMLVVAYIFLTAEGLARRQSRSIAPLLLAGVGTTMFEPHAIFGNFFSTLVFWVFVGVFFSMSPRVQNSRQRTLLMGR